MMGRLKTLCLWLRRLWLRLKWRVTGGVRDSLERNGIDVSEMNGDVNFDKLRGKIDFAIIRCGYGGNYPGQDDIKFEENVRKCQAAGIPWGVYLYAYAKDKSMAEDEARHTLRLLNGRKPPYGVWYDMEDGSLPGSSAIIDVCETYCSRLEAAGYYVGIYASLSWLKKKGRLDSPRLDRYDKWVAQWNGTCDYQAPYGMWQYTDSGTLNGKRYDRNYAYKDYPKITGDEEEMTQEEFKKMLKNCQEEFNKMMEVYESQEREKPADNWAVSVWKKACGRRVFDSSAPRSPLKREEAAQVLNNLGLLDD